MAPFKMAFIDDLPFYYQVIDPGPSYMILNLGFIVTCYLYVYFFKTIKYYLKVPIPFVVIIVILSIFFSLFIVILFYPIIYFPISLKSPCLKTPSFHERPVAWFYVTAQI